MGTGAARLKDHMAPIGAIVARVRAALAQAWAALAQSAREIREEERISASRSILTLLLLAVLATPSSAGQASPQVGGSLARAAARQVGVTVLYDPAYVRLAYPNGDPPLARGVCADVVVRAFRTIGVDLQVLLHEDMKRSFAAYPRSWGLTAPDPNIDHRRVPNLMKYFDRQGKRLPSAEPYEPGDVVAWRLPGGLYHIGIVAEDRIPGTNRPYMIHNIGQGARKEDVLYSFEILGHYRW